MRYFLFALLVSFLLISTPLIAQEQEAARGKIGITFPGTGMILHLTDHVALLPGVSFSQNWSSLSTVPTTTSGDSLAVLAALRFYVSDWKGLRFYVSPKYQFGRTTSERIAGAPVYGTDSTSTSRTHGVYGAWGVQYAISDRVSIFGDMGGYYSRATGTTTNLATLGGDSHGSAIGTSGSWGLILYLK